MFNSGLSVFIKVLLLLLSQTQRLQHYILAQLISLFPVWHHSNVWEKPLYSPTCC